ncbi:ABC transporter substrate-binding protein [Streptomyces boninensis]|uniref:ABC transporter substrate-binding protein n=1 Tax=Streptomyces boninensis TaxID=2039455 RepID=UPI003B21725B
MQHPETGRPTRLTRGLAAAAAAIGLLLIGLIAIPASAAATGADGTDATPDGKGGKDTLTVAIAQSVDTLNPFTATRLSATNMMRLMYEFPTNYDPKDPSKVLPALATKWKSSPDKLTWTYTIRDNSEWSDGKPVTAEDAAWTFNKMMTDDGAKTANGSFVTNFDKVTAPDDETLVIKLKKPQATMLALDVPIVPKHIWSKVKNIAEFTNDKDFPIVGNGPFVLTDYKTDEYVKFKPNKKFWRGAPAFDELVFRFYKDNDAAVSALKKGEVSFVPDLTPAQATALEGADNIKVNDAAGKRFWALATNPGAKAKNGKKFGNGNKALLDADFRKALFHAVDRKTIVDKVLQGHGVEGEGYLPPRYEDYFWKPAADQKIDYDKKQAASLLTKAGYKEKGGQRLGKDGKPITLRLMCHATDPKDKAASKYLEEWWGELGIKTKTTCLDNVGDPWVAGEYDIAFDGWSVNPDPDLVLALHTCDALPNTPKDVGLTDNFICSKKFDGLYNQQIREYDPAKRTAIVKDMQSWLYDSGYMNVLAYPNSVEAYRTDQIKSITAMPASNGNIWGQDGYWSWWSAKPATGETKASSGGSSSTGVIIGIAAAVVVAAGIGGLVLVRRRSTAQDRE